MNKKGAILIVLGIQALAYLFLLVGLPALEQAVPPCGSCNETVDNVSISTANLTFVGPDIDVRPYREIYKAPLILYFVPGLVGFALIVMILSKKEGGKIDE